MMTRESHIPAAAGRFPMSIRFPTVSGRVRFCCTLLWTALVCTPGAGAGASSDVVTDIGTGGKDAEGLVVADGYAAYGLNCHGTVGEVWSVRLADGKRTKLAAG